MGDGKNHHVYLIKSTTTNRTYIGYTVDIQKRLRQHNGELVGGAKYTKIGRPWELVCYVTGFPDHRTALQYEWRNHHPSGRPRGRGKGGLIKRIQNLGRIIKLKKFTNGCIDTSNLMFLIIWSSEYCKYIPYCH